MEIGVAADDVNTVIDGVIRSFQHWDTAFISLIDTGHANTSFIALHNFCKSCNSSINRDIIAEIWYPEKVPVIEDLHLREVAMKNSNV